MADTLLVDRVLSCGGLSQISTQGGDGTPSPHYDHQTLIFLSSLPRGLVLHMAIPHFLEEMVFQAPLFSLGLVLTQGRQTKTGRDQRLLLFIN